MLTLVPFAPCHFAILADWFRSDADVVQWGGPAVAFPLGADQCRAMLDERRCFTAERDGVPVGHAQIGLDPPRGRAMLSRVAIAPPARGAGLAGAMLGLVLEVAFRLPSVARVELNVYLRNVAAMRTYARLGFEVEAVHRGTVAFDGERWDTAAMSLRRPARDAGY